MDVKTEPNRTLLVTGASGRLARPVVELRLETQTGDRLVATAMWEVLK